jgi:type IV secretion system protein VirD4
VPPQPFIAPRGTPQTAERGTAPSARWSTPAELAGADWAYQPGRIFLGRSNGRLIGVDDPRHLMTVAGSRAGKSKSCLVPNLYLWPGSAVVIDPKGEVAMMTAEHRAASGQAVFILDPFNQVEGPAQQFRARFNPLAELVRDDQSDVPDDAALIADALILESGGDTHWTSSAKNLMKGLILYLLHAKRPTLNALRDLLTLEIDGTDENDSDRPWLTTIFKLMSERDDDDDGFDGVMSNIGSAMGSKSKTELSSIVSTAVEQTDFLGGKLSAILGASDFRMADLKQRPMTVYLVLPASRMGTHNRWLRLMISLALLALERDKTIPEHRVMVVLEEFAQLGYLRQLEAGVALMAGYGVLIWTILQDLNQLVAHYRDGWQTFTGNAGVLQCFANADERTLKYISERLGFLTLREDTSIAMTHGMASAGDDGRRTQLRQTPLLAPFEIALHFGRKTDQQLVLIPDRTPAAIERVWFDDPVFERGG